jgi:small subunit ribosomal protein S4
MNRRAKAPGQHGEGRRNKPSNYGIQLREKQKVKRYYGLLENQFKRHFDKAEKQAGITGENFLRILETRLDNTVFRMGMAASRKEARQLVTHGHFTINGKKATIPSMMIKIGDLVAVKEKSKASPKFKEIAEKSVSVPSWLSVDPEKMEGKVVALPSREDIDIPVEEHLIVELYSK